MTASGAAGNTGITGLTERGVPNRILLMALALGAFAIGTDSLVISGLLVHIAVGIHVSTTAAGQLISAFALAYAIGAPVLATLTGMVNRKRLLLTALTVSLSPTCWAPSPRTTRCSWPRGYWRRWGRPFICPAP